MGTELIWLESIETAEVDRSIANRTKATIVALSPQVIDALERAGVPHRTPEEFIDRALLGEVGRRNYDNLEELGRWVWDWMKSVHESLAVNPVFAHFYRLKLFLDSVGLRVAETAAVLRAMRPAKVIVMQGPEDALWASDDSFEFVTTDGPIYGIVVPFVARHLGIEVEFEKDSSRAKPKDDQTVAVRCKAWLSLVREAYALSQCLLDRFRRTETIWVLGAAYHDMPELLRASDASGKFRRRNLSLWSSLVGKRYVQWSQRNACETDGLENVLRARWPELQERLASHPLFETVGINYFPLVKGQLTHLFSQGIVETERCFRAAKRLAEGSHVRLLLATHTGSYRDLILTQALKSLRVPAVYAQEGGFSGYCEYHMPHYMELSQSDYFLTYGPGVATWLVSARLTNRQQGRPLAVGGLRFRTLQSRRATAGRHANGIARVMYIPTADFHHSLRYAPLNYSDREYYTIKRRVIETLLSLPGVQVTYKVPPDTLSHDSCLGFVSKHRDRIRVSEEPLTAVLDEAELFVVDWPSTVLLEVLTTTRPVVVLIDRIVCRPIPEAMRLLHRRAFVSDNLDLFLEMIRTVIKDPKSMLKGVQLEDTAFLDAYATGGKEGWSPEELARFLASV